MRSSLDRDDAFTVPRLLQTILFLALVTVLAASAASAAVHWPQNVRSTYLGGCTRSAIASLKSKHLLTPATRRSVTAYCGCTLTQLEKKVTLRDFETWAVARKKHPATERKVQAIITYCGQKTFHP
jgi:hypothetical protein